MSEHKRLAPLLGAYADDELTADERRAVDAHLHQCPECVQDLRVQLALKHRLRAEVPAGVPSAMLVRVHDHIARLGARADESRSVGAQRWPGRWLLTQLIVAWGGWLVAASLAALWIAVPHRPGAPGMGMSMGPLVPVKVDSVPEPIADAALHDFRRVAEAALPQGPELSSVQAQVPFTVPALTAPHMRLIGSWTTTIDSVPAAVLAYRCHDRLVVQYVVPEHVFFRPARVRQAIAAAGVYAAREGKIHAVGWPGTDNGSFLVGEFTAAELAAMRM
jgi:anti-sigma factor RsiW